MTIDERTTMARHAARKWKTLSMQRITMAILVSNLIACSASPSINVGNEGDGSVAGSGGASGFGGVGGFGGGDNALTAIITEPPSEMAIEVVTISCAGECKQVLAVARGGNDPYTFTWSDGVTTAAREICADEDTTLHVTVSDTAIVDGEFPYAGQSTQANVTANVLSCPSDGGVGDGGACTETNLAGTPASGRYVGPGTYVCTDGNMPVPMLTLTLDLNVDPESATQTGSLYFQWGLAVIVAESDLTGALDCSTGTLNMTVENGTWGIPGPEPMSVVTTGTFTGEVVATKGSAADTLTGTFHWVSINLDGSPSNDCLVTYDVALTP